MKQQRPITVGELIGYLQQFDDDTSVFWGTDMRDHTEMDRHERDENAYIVLADIDLYVECRTARRTEGGL